MYHSIYFGNKNTYTDWHLVSDSRPVVSMPSVKTNMIEIPGANSGLDLTDYLTGYPTYGNRSGSFNFHVLNDYKPWQVLYSEIANYLHGKEMDVQLEDDPNYYYHGRVALNGWTSNNDGTWSDISIDYDFEPYKYEVNKVIKEFPISSNGVTCNINASDLSDMPVVPVLRFNTSGYSQTVRFVNSELGINVSHTVPSSAKLIGGSTREIEFYDMVLSNFSGNNTNAFYVSGSGSKMQVIFKRGSL